jgi:hypothetical protein
MRLNFTTARRRRVNPAVFTQFTAVLTNLSMMDDANHQALCLDTFLE